MTEEQNEENRVMKPPAFKIPRATAPAIRKPSENLSLEELRAQAAAARERLNAILEKGAGSQQASKAPVASPPAPVANPEEAALEEDIVVPQVEIPAEEPAVLPELPDSLPASNEDSTEERVEEYVATPEEGYVAEEALDLVDEGNNEDDNLDPAEDLKPHPIDSVETVATALASTEKPRLEHPLGGVYSPTLLPVEDIQKPLTEQEDYPGGDEEVPAPEEKKKRGLFSRKKKPVLAEEQTEEEVEAPEEKSALSSIAADLAEKEAATEEIDRSHEFSDAPKVKTAPYVKFLLAFAVILFGISVWTNMGALGADLTTQLTVTAQAGEADGKAVCTYTFTEDSVEYDFVDDKVCAVEDGQETTMWTNDSKTVYTTVDPAADDWRHYLMMGATGMFLLAVLAWALAIRQKVKKTTIL